MTLLSRRRLLSLFGIGGLLTVVARANANQQRTSIHKLDVLAADGLRIAVGEVDLVSGHGVWREVAIPPNVTIADVVQDPHDHRRLYILNASGDVWWCDDSYTDHPNWYRVEVAAPLPLLSIRIPSIVSPE